MARRLSARLPGRGVYISPLRRDIAPHLSVLPTARELLIGFNTTIAAIPFVFSKPPGSAWRLKLAAGASHRIARHVRKASHPSHRNFRFRRIPGVRINDMAVRAAIFRPMMECLGISGLYSHRPSLVEE